MNPFVTDVESPPDPLRRVPSETSLQNDGGQEMPLEKASVVKRVMIAVIGIF
jgi:hypothetical protein